MLQSYTDHNISTCTTVTPWDKNVFTKFVHLNVTKLEYNAEDPNVYIKVMHSGTPNT